MLFNESLKKRRIREGGSNRVTRFLRVEFERIQFISHSSVDARGLTWDVENTARPAH